jgi:hypothetical protein
MTSSVSRLFVGVTTHRRLSPTPHRLHYRQMMMLLDLDELASLDRSCRLFSAERFNLFSFHEKDHGFGKGWRAFVADCLKSAGLSIDTPRVRLLAMPRVLGFVFNPISLWFVHDESEALRAVIYEVNNTFGGRHAYVFAVPAGETRLKHGTAKAFHVSPFLDLDLDYAFTLSPPDGETVALAIDVRRGGEDVLRARFLAHARPFSDRDLAAVFLALPFVTLKVVLAIHVEALKLFAKGLRLKPDPGLADRRMSASPPRA